MKTAKDSIRASMRAGWPVLLIGQPGIGKTSVCQQVADEMGYSLLVEVATTADPSDARGLPAVVDGKAEYQPYGLMRKLIETKNPTLCLIDDLGPATGEVQKAYMHLVLARRAGQFPISDHVRFVAATNDVGKKAGISGIISPLQNRFFHVRVKPHLETWVSWAQENKLRPEVIGFVRSTPTLFDGFKSPVGIEATCTPRSLHMVSDFMNAGATSLQAYQGCIGEGIGRQLVAYCKLYQELVTVEQIKQDPKKAPIPEQLDRRYAVCAAIACSNDEWDRLIVYVSRFPKELQVMCISDALSRHKELYQDNNIRSWMKDNKAVLL